MGKIIYALHKTPEFQFLATWRGGVVMNFEDCIVLIQLDRLPDGGSLQFQHDLLCYQPSDGTEGQQVLGIHIRATNEFGAYQALSKAIVTIKNELKAYEGIRWRIVTDLCPLHDDDYSQCFVDITTVNASLRCANSHQLIPPLPATSLLISAGLVAPSLGLFWFRRSIIV